MTGNQKKVCLVVSSLGKGGAQRAAAMQSVMLSNLGYNVHIVTVFSDIFYDYQGTLFNLGLFKSDRSSLLNRLKRLKKFKRYLDHENFDFIIDHRSRVQWYRELLITKFIYTKPTIYVIHSFEKSIMFTKYDWLNKYLYKNKIMVGVSETIATYYKSYFQLNHIYSITNAVNFEKIKMLANKRENETTLERSYILYYGRLDNHSKNLNLLLEAFKQSESRNNDIDLFLIGNGPDKEQLKQKAISLGIDKSVKFIPQLKNPFPFVKGAFFTVLTSAFEGFPLVLLEALSLGTPVISVDCESGPKEIINHRYNGLLVENFNAKALADAMNSFIFDNELYTTCKKNTIESVQKYSEKETTKKWQTLLNSIK